MTLDFVTASQIASGRKQLMQKECGWGLNSSKLLPHILNLADLYFALGDYVQAEQFYTRHLTISCKAYGNDHANIARCLQMVGEVCEVQGLYIEAEHYYLEALSIRERTRASESDRVCILSRLLILYRTNHEKLKAKVIEKRLRSCVTSESHRPAQNCVSASYS